MKNGIIYILLSMLILSCSTISGLQEGEILYTGIEKLEFTDKEYAESAVGEVALEEITAALSCPPNGALFGSSSIRGIPLGLWWYNSFHDSKSKLGKWFFNTFANEPVTIESVNPELRAQVAKNVLATYGYFGGDVKASIIEDKKNPKKAKVSYLVKLGEPTLYDSIEYRGFTADEDSLIYATLPASPIKRGRQFSAAELSSERERLNGVLRNNGYYYSQSGYISILADTFMMPKRAQIRIQPATGLPDAVHRQYYIGDVTYNITSNYGIASLSRERLLAKPDTIKMRSAKFIYRGDKPAVRPGTMLRNVFMRKGQLYSQELQQRSISNLTGLGIFGSTNLTFTPRSDSDTLDLLVTAQLDKPYNFVFELNATSKSNSQIGPGSRISLSRNNLFRGGEVLKFTLQGSYEWQTDKRMQGKQSVINSWEIGADISLTFPRLFLPIVHRRYLRYPATTSFSLYADQMNRSGFFRMVHLGGEATYKIKPNRTVTHTVIPFRLNYDMLQRTTEKFDSIKEANKAVANSFRDQFIPAMQYTFTYDNANTRHRNKSWVEGSVTSSGNITSLAFCAFGHSWKEKNKNIFGNPYAQFIKATAEVRNLFKIDSKNYIATRFMIGALKSYGNSSYAPYSEQFYIGGANSLRAFTVRSIGPGSYHPADGNRYSYLDETGTFKLEANVEYRFNLFDDLYGALFVDAGNVWLLEEDENRPGGKFAFDTFAKQIALNTGFGVRYDLEFMVLRVDFGIALHAPYDTGKSGYYNIPSFGDGFAWHFAIGYPF